MAIRVAPVEIVKPPKIVTKRVAKPKIKKAGTEDDGRKRSGFASMSPERLREVAALGGRGNKSEKRYFSINPDKAREAGKLGGKSKAEKTRGMADGQT
jgi:general stress protein YciG